MQPQNTITLHQPTVGATLGSPCLGCSPWHAHPTLIKFRKIYRAKYSLIIQNTAHPPTSSIPKIYRAKHSLFPKNTAHPSTSSIPKFYRAKYSLFPKNTTHPSTSSIPKFYRAKCSLSPKNTAHRCKTLTKGSGTVAKWASRFSPMFLLAPSSQHSQTLSLKISAVPGNILTMPHR